MTVALMEREELRLEWLLLSTDVKPAVTQSNGPIPIGSRCEETNTGKQFKWNGQTWTQVALNTYVANVYPLADNTYDLGSVALSFKNIYFETAVYGGSVAGSWNPSTDGVYDLGTTTGPKRWRNVIAQTIQTGITAGQTTLLQAYDTDTGPGYTTFGTLTAGTTPSFKLSNITMEGTWLASGTVTLPAVTLEGILTVPANQIIQGGAITIARAATPPNPDSLVHIWNASAGAVTALGNTLVTIENNTNCRLSFLTPNFADSGIIFGDPEDNDSSWILYGHSTNNYKVRLNGTERLFYSAGAFAFQEATNITSTATLTLQGNIAQDISLWGTLGTGRTLALIGTDATNGAVNDSPSLVMRAFYDADPTAGVTSTAWNYTILHDMLTAGATPSSSVLHSINSVLGYSMTNNNGTMSHSFVGVVTTGGLTFSASALALNAPNLADGDYFTIGARNSSTDAIVEVARVVGGNTPYIAFGLSQQVLFYNDGSGTLGTGLGFGALNGNAAASIISARNSVDGDYLIFRARDSDTDTLVEVSRVAGASDPYFSMGGSGQFKFYNGGTCDFANPVMFSVGVISALVANQVSLGGYDVGGVDGHRALSWSQEDPIVVAIAAASTHKVPITFNGTTIYLLASNV